MAARKGTNVKQERKTGGRKDSSGGAPARRTRSLGRLKVTHPLALFSGSANRPLAERIADHLGSSLRACTTTRLPDSEIHVALDDPVRGDDVFLIQPCSSPVNDHLIELLLYVDALRRASAHTITAVIPYFPYARQERMAKGREAISAKVVASNLESLGVDRVLYVDIHAPAIQGFFSVPVDPLTAVEVLAAAYRGPEFENAAIVAPDEGRVKLAGKYADTLDLPLVLMHKKRTGFDSAKVTHVVGDIAGKIPIVIDDVIAGGSILDQLQSLIDQGAKPQIHLAITHGVLTESALQRLDRPEIQRLIITDTIPMTPERSHPKVEVRSIAPLLAEAIRRIHEGHSIGSLLQRT